MNFKVVVNDVVRSRGAERQKLCLPIVFAERNVLSARTWRPTKPARFSPRAKRPACSRRAGRDQKTFRRRLGRHARRPASRLARQMAAGPREQHRANCPCNRRSSVRSRSPTALHGSVKGSRHTGYLGHAVTELPNTSASDSRQPSADWIHYADVAFARGSATA